MYGALKTYKTVKSLGPDHNFTLLTPGGTVDEFATFLILEKENSSDMFFNSCNPNPQMMIELVKRCDYIDWKKKMMIGPVSEKYESALLKLFTELNVEKILQDNRASIHWCNPESGINLTYKIPDDVYIGPIEERHAELINSVWPHRCDDSLIYVIKVIKYLGGLGLYAKETDELVSWTLHTMFGGPGFLQTLEGQKGKGYGLLLATAMTKNYAEKGEYSSLVIVDGNTSSLKIFEKLNYEKGGGVHWYWLN